MSNDLFRTEAFQAKTDPFATRTRMVVPPGFLAYTLLTLCVTVCVVLFVFFGQYSPKDTVRGYVVTAVGDVEVYAQSDGTIVDLRVAEGDRVEKNQELLLLSTSRAIGQSPATRKSIVSALRSELSDLRIQIQRENEEFSLQEQGGAEEIASLTRRLAMLHEQRDDLAIGLALSRRELKRLTTPAAEQFTSQNDQDRARAATVEFKLRMHRLHLSIDSLKSEIRRSRQTSQEIPARRDARAAETSARSRRLDLQIAEAMGRDTQRVLAPSAGIVSGLLVREGQTIGANNPLLNLVPEHGEFYAELLIPTKTIAFVRPGAVVKIRYDAYPYQKFGTFDGVIHSLSRTTVLPTDKRFRVAIAEPVYMARMNIQNQAVRGEGEPQFLQSGMTLTADILRDERKLIEWLFDPLISAVQRQ